MTSLNSYTQNIDIVPVVINNTVYYAFSEDVVRKIDTTIISLQQQRSLNYELKNSLNLSDSIILNQEHQIEKLQSKSVLLQQNINNYQEINLQFANREEWYEKQIKKHRRINYIVGGVSIVIIILVI